MSEKKFPTVYDRERSFSCSGDPLVNDYVSVYDEDGARSLEISGQYSIFDEIQSYRDSCDLSLILERFQKTGDVSLLQRRQGFYADVTEYPKTYADMLRVSQAAKEIFDALKTEDKLKFNNDPDQFLASFGTKKFDEVFGKYHDPEDGGISTAPEKGVELSES